MGDDVLARIGMDVLERWNSDSALQMSRGRRTREAREIDSLLTREAAEKDGWKERMKEVIDSMTPVDFAVHGKKICSFLLETHLKPDHAPSDLALKHDATLNDLEVKHDATLEDLEVKRSELEDFEVKCDDVRSVARTWSRHTEAQAPQWLPSILHDV